MRFGLPIYRENGYKQAEYRSTSTDALGAVRFRSKRSGSAFLTFSLCDELGGPHTERAGQLGDGGDRGLVPPRLDE